MSIRHTTVCREYKIIKKLLNWYFFITKLTFIRRNSSFFSKNNSCSEYFETKDENAKIFRFSEYPLNIFFILISIFQTPSQPNFVLFQNHPY